jgi:hypothetical protein
LRTSPKLAPAPGLVLTLLILASGNADDGMVRQNASLERTVQVRAARLRATAGVPVDARYAHANLYQRLVWMNDNFSQVRLDVLTGDIRKERGSIADQLAALAAHRKRVQYTIDMAWSGMSYRKDCLS